MQRLRNIAEAAQEESAALRETADMLRQHVAKRERELAALRPVADGGRSSSGGGGGGSDEAELAKRRARVAESELEAAQEQLAALRASVQVGLSEETGGHTACRAGVPSCGASAILVAASPSSTAGGSAGRVALPTTTVARRQLKRTVIDPFAEGHRRCGATP